VARRTDRDYPDVGLAGNDIDESATRPGAAGVGGRNIDAMKVGKRTEAGSRGRVRHFPSYIGIERVASVRWRVKSDDLAVDL
jgi:hypothetical protein